MRLTREEMTNAIVGWAMQSKPNLNRALNMLMDSVETENGLVKRSPHQRRRGRPPKLKKGQIGSIEKTFFVESIPRKKKKRKYTKRSPFWKKDKVAA